MKYSNSQADAKVERKNNKRWGW